MAYAAAILIAVWLALDSYQLDRLEDRVRELEREQRERRR